jgi:hypothetical protein
VLFRDRLCPQCGNPKTLCHDVELDGELYGEPVVCHLTAAARVPNAGDGPVEGEGRSGREVDTAGVYVQVKRREVPEAPASGTAP